MIKVRKYAPCDVPDMKRIWNEVIEDGEAFPREDKLDDSTCAAFFAVQSMCGVAESDGRVVGMYILHPNNVGRCGHIGNASYAVLRSFRGRGAGEKLVRHSLASARDMGFSLMQFNAVVASNAPARGLYAKLGFVPLGIIPGGFRVKDGHYEDICLYYHALKGDFGENE